MTNIIENLEAIQKKIAKAQLKSLYKQEVTLVAVTKAVSVERTSEAIKSGVTSIGENRPEGLLVKQEYIKENAIWHYIGSLQTRKVRQVINLVDYIHSLDRLSLAKEIDKRAERRVKCFVQVNVSGEDSKQGVHPESLSTFIDELAAYANIEVIGLMTMAPFTEDETIVRNVFHKLKQLQLEIANKHLIHAPCKELSMGMSNDYAIAIEEGATFVRIGTALVGSESEEA